MTYLWHIFDILEKRWFTDASFNVVQPLICAAYSFFGCLVNVVRVIFPVGAHSCALLHSAEGTDVRLSLRASIAWFSRLFRSAMFRRASEPCRLFCDTMVAKTGLCERFMQLHSLCLCCFKMKMPVDAVCAQKWIKVCTVRIVWTQS